MVYQSISRIKWFYELNENRLLALNRSIGMILDAFESYSLNDIIIVTLSRRGKRYKKLEELSHFYERMCKLIFLLIEKGEFAKVSKFFSIVHE